MKENMQWLKIGTCVKNASVMLSLLSWYTLILCLPLLTAEFPLKNKEYTQQKYVWWPVVWSRKQWDGICIPSFSKMILIWTISLWIFSFCRVTWLESDKFLKPTSTKGSKWNKCQGLAQDGVFKEALAECWTSSCERVQVVVTHWKTGFLSSFGAALHFLLKWKITLSYKQSIQKDAAVSPSLV